VDNHHPGKGEEEMEFLIDLLVKYRKRRRRRGRRWKKGGCCDYDSNPIVVVAALTNADFLFAISWGNITLPNISVIISVSVNDIFYLNFLFLIKPSITALSSYSSISEVSLSLNTDLLLLLLLLLSLLLLLLLLSLL
jgi:hypothetical protein